MFIQYHHIQIELINSEINDSPMLLMGRLSLLEHYLPTRAVLNY